MPLYSFYCILSPDFTNFTNKGSFQGKRYKLLPGIPKLPGGKDYLPTSVAYKIDSV